MAYTTIWSVEVARARIIIAKVCPSTVKAANFRFWNLSANIPPPSWPIMFMEVNSITANAAEVFENPREFSRLDTRTPLVVPRPYMTYLYRVFFSLTRA